MTNHVPAYPTSVLEDVLVAAIKVTVIGIGALAMFSFWAGLGGVIVVAARYVFF